MANEYFTPTGYPATGAAGSSASMRSELALVEDGFDKLPTLTGNGGKIVAVNSGGTGLTTSATLSESGGTVTVTGNLSVTGDTTLGNASGDALTIASSAVTWSGNPTHSGNHTFSGGLTLASPLPTSSGGTGLSSFTANRVFYSSSTSAIGSSANLTFDGTTLTAAALSGPLNGTVGATTPASGAFTTLSATGNVNLNGGTANGVAYLNASKQVTSGSALTFDGTDFKVNTGSITSGNSTYAGSLNAIGGGSGATIAITPNTVSGSNGVVYNTSFVSGGAGPHIFQVGGSEKMRIDNSGNLGIGTSTPAAKLDVRGNATFTGNAAARQTADFTNTGGQLYVGVESSAGGAVFTGSSAYAGIVGTNTNTVLQLAANGAVRATITSGGDVGIGTSTPNAKLHVQRDFGGITETLRLQNNSTNATVGRGAQIAFVGTSGGLLGSISGSTSTTADDQGSLIYSANGATSSHLFFTNSAERMRITAAGDVGIGVTPSASWGSGFKALQIGAQGQGIAASTAVSQVWLSSNGVFNGTNWLYFNSASAGQYQIDGNAHKWFYASSGTSGNTISFTQAMTLDGSGNLGIGTSSPAQILDIVRTQNSATVTVVRNASTGATASAQFVVNADTATGRFAAYSSGAGALANHVSIEQTTNNPITFYTNSSERVRITGAGDVGIGTNSPATKLHIVDNGTGQVFTSSGGANFNIGILAGGATADAYVYQRANAPLIFGTNNNDRMRITSGGDVGIGTTTPGARLTVKGTATITVSDVDSYAASFGNDALGAVAVGSDASNGYIQAFAGRALKLNNQGNAVHVKPAYDNTTATAANVVVESDGYLKRSTSSLRYKRDVQDATHGLSEVLKLRSVTYKGKNDGEKVIGGLIAEEVDAAGLHEFVAYDEEGRPDALHYGNMVSLLVKAVQELKAELDVAKARIAALEAQ